MDESGILHYIQHWGLNIRHNPISLPNIDYKVGGLTRIKKQQRKSLKPTPTPIPSAVSQGDGIVEKETPATPDDKTKITAGTAGSKAKATTNHRSLSPSNILVLPDAIGAGGGPPNNVTTKDSHTSSTHDKVEGSKEESTHPLLRRCLPKSQAMRKLQRTRVSTMRLKHGWISLDLPFLQTVVKATWRFSPPRF